MVRLRIRPIAALIALLALTAPGGSAMAEMAPAAPPAQQNYQGAQYVQVTLGPFNDEQGLGLVDGQPDGVTEGFGDRPGRQSRPNAGGTERYFYFDVHDTYVKGGHNKVRMTITYQDLGLTPIFLEYDSFDPLRPLSHAEELTRKRIAVASRTNSEGLKTVFVDLPDARFDGSQPGGADFRIGSGDDLVLSNVSVMVMSRVPVVPPVRVVLDGKEIMYDPEEVLPFVHPETSRTLVPIRATLNALGVSNDSIAFHGETRTVEFRKGNTTIALTIDDVVVQINGKTAADPLDQPATIVAGRTVVPLRFVAEQFGLKVAWDSVGRIVTLTTVVSDPSTQDPSTRVPSTQDPSTEDPSTQILPPPSQAKP
ncbi:MAG TPA: copper amine oxidase N-terminal domain-containing protein [Symbiobacteriaceae bacterium]|nr:copper amine oxidase N-terminal domain-containing protein [Symbiobacteriaceae bacterium]